MANQLPNLKTLYLDFLDTLLIRHFLKLFDSPKLAHVSVSAIPHDSTHPEWADATPDICRMCDKLQTFTIVSAWSVFRFHIQEDNHAWYPSMSVCQLYIVNPRIRYERQTTVHRIMFLGQPLSPNSFGGAYPVAVNHMRLEQVDLSKLVVDKIDDKIDNLQQLRILVIRSPLEDTDDHMAD
ncbi:hypothetical protein OEA41_002559 [Lepraria neglecta]|uniref:Uncharacterized protein n=1 Tax=Lepraria neglecta TaxID=209136 RepID=A0AAD9ZEI4_9LECA|nr:hypothetical protein OEA41_002559 [Lepraria neglecta]